MTFKDETIKSEWHDERLKSDIKVLVYALAGYCRDKFEDMEPTITSVFYQKGQFGSQTSVHEEWRGVDVTLRGFNAILVDAAMKDATEWINNNFMLSTPGMKPAVYHTTGHGWHIHLQVARHSGLTVVRRGV